MERTYISDVRSHAGRDHKSAGFIENLRSSKAMAFIVLKDITGKLQITIEKEDHTRPCARHRPADRRLGHHGGGTGRPGRLRQAGRHRR